MSQPHYSGMHSRCLMPMSTPGMPLTPTKPHPSSSAPLHPSFWRFYTRLQLQNAITQRSYKTYEATLFGGTGLLLLILAIVGWLHLVLRTKTHFRWQW